MQAFDGHSTSGEREKEEAIDVYVRWGRLRSFEAAAAAAAEEPNECGQFMRLDRSLPLGVKKEEERRKRRKRRGASGIVLRPQNRTCSLYLQGRNSSVTQTNFILLLLKEQDYFLTSTEWKQEQDGEWQCHDTYRCNMQGMSSLFLRREYTNFGTKPTSPLGSIKAG